VSDPESRLIRASYANGGGWWEGEREAVGYRVLRASCWVFAGTGLTDGQEFGAAERLVGYECDGAPVHMSERGQIEPVPNPDASVEVLAVGVLGAGWHVETRSDDSGCHAATVVLAVGRGTVFNAGTTDWPRLLGRLPLIDRITSNVMRELSGTV
jgi:hypothetical protein